MSERPYRIATAGLLVTALSISGYYRRRAETGEDIGARASGGALWTLRVAALGAFGTLAGYVLAPARVSRARVALPRPVRLFGGAIAGLCLPLFYWVFATLDRNVTPTATVREKATLVTDGPYRFVRHPLYTVAAVFWFGLVLLSGVWVVVAVLVLGGWVITRRTPEEERRLAERFGDEYRAYCERTGRYVPRLQ